MPTGNDTKIVKSICSMCLKYCGIDAHVRDGKLVRVTGMKEHPFNRLCVKARATLTTRGVTPSQLTLGLSQ